MAHGAMNKERQVCARRRDGEAAGPGGLVGRQDPKAPLLLVIRDPINRARFIIRD